MKFYIIFILLIFFVLIIYKRPKPIEPQQELSSPIDLNDESSKPELPPKPNQRINSTPPTKPTKPIQPRTHLPPYHLPPYNLPPDNLPHNLIRPR